VPAAFLGIWRWPDDEPGAAGRGRVVALRTDTGVVGDVPVAGAPERLLATSKVGGTPSPGPRLLAVEEVPGPRHAARTPEPVPPERWHLLAVEPLAGLVEAVYPVAAPPRALAVAPDGQHAYLLAALDGPRSVLTHVDLASGATRRLATVPGLSLDLAVTGDRIYLPRADDNVLLVLDRQHGRVVGTIPVGRRPVGLTLGAGAL